MNTTAERFKAEILNKLDQITVEQNAAIHNAGARLIARGVTPLVYKSKNIGGGPEYNQSMIEQFKDRLAEY